MLILPHERDALLGPPGMIPPGNLPVRADPTHPLCPTVAYLPGLGVHDVCGNGPPLVRQVNAALAVGAAGPAARHAAANSFLRTADWPTRLWSPGGTIFWWGRALGTHAANPALASLMWPSNGQPFVVLASLLNGSGNQGLRAGWNSAGVVRVIDSPTALQSVTTMAVAHGGGAGVGLFVASYADGRQIGIVGNEVNALGYAAGVNFAIGGDSLDPNRHPNADTFAAMWWPRPISAADIASLHADPLQWLTVG